MDKLTDEIVEDMISRVANCNELVQAVFVEQGLVTSLVWPVIVFSVTINDESFVQLKFNELAYNLSW